MTRAKKSGLPDHIRMRHDNHYVELISEKSFGPKIRMINIDEIYPSPNQSRTELGNIHELMDSIKEKGILEPILVRRKDELYEIIAGERRYAAAKNIGIKHIPCIEMIVSDNEAIEIALIENIQRKDLDIFEEAEGIKTLSELYEYSHEKIAKKIGKARSTVTEIIGICRIPEEIRKMCDGYNIKSRSTIIEISKQKNKEDMHRLIEEIKKREMKREDTRDLSKLIKGKEKREKPFVYKYSEKERKFKIKIEIRKQNVTEKDIIEILEEIINKIKEKRI